MSHSVMAIAYKENPRKTLFSTMMLYQENAPRILTTFQAPMRHQRMNEITINTTAKSLFGVPILYFKTEPIRLRMSATAGIPDEMMKTSM